MIAYKIAGVQSAHLCVTIPPFKKKDCFNVPLKIRLFLYYSFMGLFFISLPVFTLYSLGYRLNFKTHRMERMGMISIHTVPEDASIELNGKRLKQKTPVKLPDLFPGKYTLTLFRKDLRPWKGEVWVKPNWVTRLESIILFPEKIMFQPVTDLEVRRFFLSPKAKKMILWVESGEDRGLWLLDLFLEEETFILDESSVPGNIFVEKEIEIFWSKDERAVLIEKNKEYFLLDLKKPNRIVSLKELLGFNPEEVAWSGKLPDAFFHLHQGTIDKYSIRQRKMEYRILQNVQNFRYEGNFIYYIEKGTGEIRRSSEDLAEKEDLGRVPDFDPKAQYEIFVNPAAELLSPHHQMGIWKDRSIFYDLTGSRKFEGIRNVLCNKSEREILLVNNDKGFVLPGLVGKIKGETEPIIISIPKGTKKIFWFDVDKFIFVSRKNANLCRPGIDTDSYTQEIFSFPWRWRDVQWDERFKQLYLIEDTESLLMRVNLAQGALNKLVQNMRETMSDGLQLLYEIGKKQS